MSVAVTDLHGVPVYNLAAGKTLPQWLAEKSQKSLRKDQEYLRRVELLQDFEFPVASQTVRVSPDQEWCIATGVYQPEVRCFEFKQLAMKWNRRVDSEISKTLFLGDDWKKLCFLQVDRYVEFHAQYGRHYRTRIPKTGRDMAYHAPTCELLVCGSSEQIYRINLDVGRFVTPLDSCQEALDCTAINPVHHLFGFGGEQGLVECFDPRSKDRVGVLNVGVLAGGANETKNGVTALAFHGDGLTMACGTKSGHTALFDLRAPQPLLVKDNNYGLPILDVKFHEKANKVLSSDAKAIKVWDRKDGTPFTTVEPPADIAAVELVGRQGEESGLLFVAGEHTRVQPFFIPDLGNAPAWCAHLENLTEELADEGHTAVYDDYKFVTRKELSELGVEHLIGSKFLRAYMHGFFMDARLYERTKALANPFSYEKWRKDKIKEKMEKKKATRISITKRLPKVNTQLAQTIMQSQAQREQEQEDAAAARAAREAGEEDDDGEEERKSKQRSSKQKKKDKQAEGLLQDDRFAALFTNPEFEIDPNSEDFRLINPTTGKSELPNANAAKRRSNKQIAFEQRIGSKDNGDGTEEDGTEKKDAKRARTQQGSSRELTFTPQATLNARKRAKEEKREKQERRAQRRGVGSLGLANPDRAGGKGRYRK